MNPKLPIPEDGLPLPQRYWAMLTVGMAVFMTVTDQTIVNVALPTIGPDLGIGPADSVWIINAYQVAIMLSLLPLSSVGDIFGYKRVYITGLALFGCASLGCALAPSLTVLVLMRVLQGLGAAGVMSVNMALVRYIHPINRLGFGIGINALVISVSAAAGPSLASAVLGFASWPWLFAINIPVSIGAVAIGYYALPDTPRASHSFDVISAILSAITFGSLIAFVDSIRLAGPAVPLGLLVFTLLVGYVLCRRQFQMPSPLLPVDLLRIPMFTLSLGTSICSFLAMSQAFIGIPFHLHAIGYTAAQIGLLMTPWPIMAAFLALIAGKLSDRFPAGALGLVGLSGCALALLAMSFTTAETSMAGIMLRMAVGGACFGLFQSPNNRTIQASAPRRRSGGASGMQAMARLLGQTVGAALAAILLAWFANGAVATLWSAAICAGLAAAISALRIRESKPDFSD